MRSPSPHDANDTDAAAFSGELAAWQQHNAGALFPHPHGELLVAPLNPNPNPNQNPNQNPNPTCHHQFSTNAQLPHFVPPSSSEFTMDPRTSAPPLRYSAPYSMSPYPPPHISPRALPSASPASYLHLSDHASAWSALSGPSSHSHSSGVAHLQAELARLTPYPSTTPPHSLCSLWLSCLPYPFWHFLPPPLPSTHLSPFLPLCFS